jgi:hypothetical protein
LKHFQPGATPVTEAMMGREASAKRGLQSSARKSASSRHGVDPSPATSQVPGAFGKGDRKAPAKIASLRRQRAAGGGKARPRGIATVNPATGETIQIFQAMD